MDAHPVILLTKHRETARLGSGLVRNVFDVVGHEGLKVTCLVDPTNSSCQGEPALVAQLFELDDGRKFFKIDEALAAWRADNVVSAEIDGMAQALRLFAHGLARTRWSELSDVDKMPWWQSAKRMSRLFAAAGLQIVATEGDDDGQ